LCEVTNMKLCLPLFIFLGKLTDAIPAIIDLFVTDHYNLVDCLPQGIMYPNELVKASICYLYGKLFSSPSAAEKLCSHFSETMCGLFLATLENAQMRELKINCMGLLKQLLNYDYTVALIMNESEWLGDSEDTPTLQPRNPLPLVLKKVLLSREELLQIASAQCIAAILVHSPTKYAPIFICADIPEFLFEHLLSTNEILIWSVYCCLLLMAEERLFYSKCYTVYGIESLVKSLKYILQLNNIELQRQGLLLLREILNRQPVQIKLFTNPGIFRSAIDLLQDAVNCPVLEVAVEANRSASAFLRKNHLSIPVQYAELQKLINKILQCCADLPLPSQIKKHMCHSGSRDQNRITTQQQQLLTTALQSFHHACKLVFECQSDPQVQENAFTAPGSESEDTLHNFSCFLLKICDYLCIPTVLKYYERGCISASMEIFFLILCDLFTVVPTMKDTFAVKLASVSFIRLALQVKSSFYAGQRYPNLNLACSDFLCALISILWMVKCGGTNESQNEVSDLFHRNLIHLSGSMSENFYLLLESPNSCITNKSLREHQYILLVIIFIAYIMEDRLVLETDLFWAVLSFLKSVQDVGDVIPSYILKASLYLLAVCQDKCETLTEPLLNGICRMLESITDLQIIYFHHPLFLKFFFNYPQLMKKFGGKIAEFYISMHDFSNKMSTILPLNDILQRDPEAMLILLDIITNGSVELASKVFVILASFLYGTECSHISAVLCGRLLYILQRILIEGRSSEIKDNLPLILKLLYLVKIKSQPECMMESSDFKLLYHISNISGKCHVNNYTILQPCFNFLYCSLHLSPPSCRIRGTAMLLSNTKLIELIEQITLLTWVDPKSSLTEMQDATCCSAWFIASSLVYFQHCYNLEVSNSFSQITNGLVLK
ncbi:hypothetical protein GDO86_007533, partial [Hymenochirus boettgeri]